jgi:hypothetical protein
MCSVFPSNTKRAAIVVGLCVGLAAMRGQTAAPPPASMADWLTDGGDPQRTGWQRQERALSKDNVGQLQLLWKLSTGNQPRGLHGLTPVLVIGRLNTPAGPKQVGIVSGISDNLYGFDADSGTILWQRHWTYKPPFGGDPNADPAHLNFLAPGGSTDTPVIGPEDAEGRRPIYWVTGDGMMSVINAADGTDLDSPFMFTRGKGGSLNLVDDVIWMPHGVTLSAIRVAGLQHSLAVAKSKVLAPVLGRYIPAARMFFSVGSGGMWGRRGVAVDSTGTAWSTTGDGISDAASGKYANGVVGLQVVGSELKLKDYYIPSNWEWLLKRDLDASSNTPAIVEARGRELIAASGKECRVVLLDARSPGGPNHRTPLYRSPVFCNEDADFQNAGSWGGVSTWQDAAGVVWVLVPFWGPVHSQMKFPISNGPVSGGGVAAFKLDEVRGALQLTPAWVSRDMKRGESVAIANGIVFGYGSGEETQQAWPEKFGLQLDASIRATKGTRATIYALDAQTGRELWSSGDQIHQWNHFTGLTVANGHVYLSTHDGTIYCFGLHGRAN